AVRSLGGNAPPRCGVGGRQASRPAVAAAPRFRIAASPRTTGQRRVYRLAVGATGEYTQYHNDHDPANGGPRADALAAIVTAVNRITGVFEQDLNIRLELIANNDQIIYTNAATDPFSNGDASRMMEENQDNTDAVIGDANYDIGHLFATDGGGLALVGAICDSGFKAQGVSGYDFPEGDPFHIDLVAHEIAHQFNADHTFNGTTESCAGNRNPSTAFEPGSGSTIMSYAGICGEENVTLFAEAYFHAGSIQQMVEFTNSGSGSGCGQLVATGNNPPTVDAGPDLSIPKQTPFTLTGSATDPEGQPLVYQWDEMDAGEATDATKYGTDLGSNPLFRSRMPAASPSRTFPAMPQILAGTVSKAEVLPATARTLKFRLVVKDGQGGVAEDDRVLTVVADSGPFRVTQPNTAVTLDNTQTQGIAWEVAGTDQAPINCSAVDIRLSDDDGATFGTDLLLATPNDGAAEVTLPGIETQSARIMVACSDNVFFDVSDSPFEIASGSGIALQPPPSSGGGSGGTGSGRGSSGSDGDPPAGGGGGGVDPGLLLIAGLLAVGRRRRCRLNCRRL
ncbi:MAG TPA: hypothetical protein EYH03_04320, partial [Chromatiales bacterium]|nr:hypothetical protein [Chromatiales bacterium]